MGKMNRPKIANHNRRFFRHLHLTDFTVFDEANLEFIPQGLNVFVGENGTGKTHAMKVLYSWMLSQSFKDAQDWGYLKTLLRVMPAIDQESLVRHGESRAELTMAYGERDWHDVFYGTNASDGGIRGEVLVPDIPRPVFIPAVDMMGHTKGFGDTYDVHGIDFDYTFREIVRLLNVNAPEPAPGLRTVISKLAKSSLQGEVEFDRSDDRFYLKQKNHRVPMPMVAEGLRKLATLQRLLTNGTIKAGTTLFWDEPEVNLNPKLMDDLVDALLAVVRSGVQVIIATHSYVILEEIADRAKPGEVRYFGFEPGKQGVTVRQADQLAQLQPNPILDQYEDLSNRKLTKAFAPRNDR